MKRGTKSLLFGVHCLPIHTAFVALGWLVAYKRLPLDPRVWVAFLVHDVGYWGCETMDGYDGERHPGEGALLMHRWFDRDDAIGRPTWRWFDFAAGHSRSYAATAGIPLSPLMRADKLATYLYPRWLFVLLAWLSGEGTEYCRRWLDSGAYPGQPGDSLWVYAGHLQANWARFLKPDAVAGRAWGGE